MIQIENLSKVFRTSEVETIALNHVNIEVKEGEFVAIMGWTILLKAVTSCWAMK